MLLAQPVAVAADTTDTRSPEPVRLAQAATTTPLPSLQIGPPPAAKAPEKLPDQPPAAPRQFDRGEQKLQLRIDPQTGKPLTAEDLKAREAGEAATPPSAPQRLQPRRLIVPRPKREAQDAEAAPAAPAEEPAPEDIVIERLARPDPGSIGVLDVEQGGLGLDMWQGSALALVGRLLPELPVASRSAAVRDLGRRLLLSTARAPSGLGDGAAVLRQRVERLWAAGWLEDAEALLRVVPPAAEAPELDAIRLNMLLISGRTSDACNLARNLLDRTPTPELKQAAAYCLAMEGRTAELDLYEQVLYADGIEDPAYFRLLAQLSGREAIEPVDLPAPTPLHLAMLQASDRQPPPDVLERGSAQAIRMLALSARTPPALRAEAAEIAAERGIVSIDALRSIYQELPLSAKQAADPIAFAGEEPGALAAASFYRAIAHSQNIEAMLNLVEEAWRHARARGRADVLAQAMRPQLEAIQPTEELAVYATITMRVLLRGGALEAARNWFQALLRPARLGDPHAAAAVLDLVPLIYAADFDEQVRAPAQAVSIWWRARSDAGLDDGPPSRAVVLALLEGLGRPMPEALWIDAIAAEPVRGGAAPAAALARQLADAAASGRRAETVLLALTILGNTGPQDTADAVLARIVVALKQVGLTREAHALTVEGLLKRGF